MFIGREKELQFLEDKYNQPGGQFIVLYGRRRIGKTETLREFCKNKEHVFFSCRECPDKIQLRNFSTRLLKENISASQYIDEFKDWEQAFMAINDLPFHNKKLVIIDEFPYMCKTNPSIPSILQNLWDESFKDSNIMLIICGSAMSFIEKEILSEKNPLYGRATGIYKMKEMNFTDAMKFFPNYSIEENILVYSILGGIPHYLKQFNPMLSIEDNIKKNILTKGCTLYNEVEFLLHQELRETSLYNSIIESIALGNKKINEISTHVLINNSSKTSVYLKNLIELGIIERELSIDSGSKEISNNNRGIYQLTDNYFRFWYSYVFSNYSDLEEGDVEGVYKYVIEPSLYKFASLPFETICKQFVRELQIKGLLPFRYEKMGRWFGKTTIRDTSNSNALKVSETEIDILAFSKKEKAFLIGECKFKNSPFRYSEYLDTLAKLSPLKETNQFYYFLFSKSGFDNNLLEEAKQNKFIHLYTLDDLVSN